MVIAAVWCGRPPISCSMAGDGAAFLRPWARVEGPPAPTCRRGGPGAAESVDVVLGMDSATSELKTWLRFR